MAFNFFFSPLLGSRLDCIKREKKKLLYPPQLPPCNLIPMPKAARKKNRETLKNATRRLPLRLSISPFCFSFSFSFESHSVTLISKPQIYIASLELIWPALLLGPLIVVRIGMLLEDFQVGVVLYAEKEGRSQFSEHYIYTLCFYSPLEKSIKAMRSSVKEKEKENLRAPCDKMHRWIWAWLLSREFHWG